jgi:hypothetical protein
MDAAVGNVENDALSGEAKKCYKPAWHSECNTIAARLEKCGVGIAGSDDTGEELVRRAGTDQATFIERSFAVPR